MDFSNVFPAFLAFSHSHARVRSPHAAPTSSSPFLSQMRSTNIPMTLGLPENRAATMSTASGPPLPLPGPPSERSASPDRKSRTLQGPSPKEWARHRETIIDLYRQFPLKRVSEIMRKHHGFSAR